MTTSIFQTTRPKCWRRYNQYLMIWRNQIEGTIEFFFCFGKARVKRWWLRWMPRVKADFGVSCRGSSSNLRVQDRILASYVFFFFGTSSIRLVLHSLLLGGLGCYQWYQVTLPKSTREEVAKAALAPFAKASCNSFRLDPIDLEYGGSCQSLVPVCSRIIQVI